MKKLDFPKKMFIVSMIFFIACIGIFVFVFKKIDSTNKESEKMFNEWRVEDGRRKEIKSLEDSFEKTKNDKNIIESHFIKSYNIVPFLNALESLGNKLGMKTEITSVDILENSGVLSVGIKTVGTFDSINKFFLLLENSQFEIDFKSFDITKVEKSNNWEANLKINLISFIN